MRRQPWWAIWVWTLIVTLGVPSGIALAETVFVQAKTAKLRAGKTSLERVVADLKFGEALDVLKKEDNWLEVSTAAGVK